MGRQTMRRAVQLLQVPIPEFILPCTAAASLQERDQERTSEELGTDLLDQWSSHSARYQDPDAQDALKAT